MLIGREAIINNIRDEDFRTVYSPKIKKPLALCTVILTLIVKFLIINVKTSNVIMYVIYRTRKYYSLKMKKKPVKDRRRPADPVPAMTRINTICVTQEVSSRFETAL